MSSDPRTVNVPAVLLLVLGWFILFAVFPGDFPFDVFIVNLLLGTLYGLTTVASAWVAIGLGQLQVRLVASISIVMLSITSLIMNLLLHSEPLGPLPIILPVCLAGQWLLVQPPLWLAAFYGVRLRHDSAPSDDVSQRQYGVRELLIATTIVAVILAAIRLMIPNLVETFIGSDWVIFAFMNAAAVIVSVPLLLAALLPRYAVPAVAMVIVLIVLFTIWETPLREQLEVSGGPPNAHFAWLNGITGFWVLAFVACFRYCGYGVSGPETRSGTNG